MGEFTMPGRQRDYELPKPEKRNINKTIKSHPLIKIIFLYLFGALIEIIIQLIFKIIFGR